MEFMIPCKVVWANFYLLFLAETQAMIRQQNKADLVL